MMSPIDFVGLRSLMQKTEGSPGVTVAVIDGPVALDHPDLPRERIREVVGRSPAACMEAGSVACVHGTFVLGILAAKRGSMAPAICPGCTFLVRPIFSESTSNGGLPSATPQELSSAIIDAIDAGANILNLSIGLVDASTRDDQKLDEALGLAIARGVITVAAAGNQGAVRSSVLTRHPWVLAVVACDRSGRPMAQSNLAASIGRHGISAPGENIKSLGAGGDPLVISGTSAATPFVTGAAALLMTQFPRATAAAVKLALTQGRPGRPVSLVPPLLNAWAAYRRLAAA